jgi:hypothetical protein
VSLCGKQASTTAKGPGFCRGFSSMGYQVKRLPESYRVKSGGQFIACIGFPKRRGVEWWWSALDLHTQPGRRLRCGRPSEGLRNAPAGAESLLQALHGKGGNRVQGYFEGGYIR